MGAAEVTDSHPRLNDMQRAAIHKIGNVRGRLASLEDIAPSISLRSLAGRGMVAVHITLTERGKAVAQQMAIARHTRKPK